MGVDTEVEKKIAALDIVLEAAQIHLSNLKSEMPPEGSPSQEPVKAVINTLTRSLSVVEAFVLETKTAANTDDGPAEMAVQVLKDHGYTITGLDHVSKPDMIRPFLDISTEHLDPDAHLTIQNVYAGGDDLNLTVDMHFTGDGYWIYAEEEDSLTFKKSPPCLQDVMRFARNKGCAWILFDRDAAVTSKLPVYDQEV